MLAQHGFGTRRLAEMAVRLGQMDGDHRVVGRQRSGLLELGQRANAASLRHGIKPFFKMGVEQETPVAFRIRSQVHHLCSRREGRQAQ